MLDRDTIRAIFDDVFAAISPAHDALIRAEGGYLATVEVRDGIIVEHTQRSVVRIVLALGEPRSLGWAWTEATTTELSTAAIQALVAEATTALANAPGDSTALQAVDSRDYGPPETADNLDADLLETGPGFRVHRVADPLLVARRYELRADGHYRLAVGGIDLDGRLSPFALATNRGLFQYAMTSTNRAALRLSAPEVAPGVGSLLLAEGVDRSQADLEPVLERHLELLGPLVSRDASLAPPTLGVDEAELDALSPIMVLDRAAVAAVLEPLLAAFSATAVMRGRSPLAGIAREQMFLGENVSLRCDVSDARQPAVPFDVEGVPTRPTELVTNGRLVDFVYGRRQAIAAGVEPTGHTADLMTGVERVRAPVMDGGEETLAALIEGVGDGLYVQRLEVRWPWPGGRSWRVLLVAPDGALRIRDGRLTGAVGPWQAEVDLDVLFGHIEAMGEPRLALGAVVPPVRVGRFDGYGPRTWLGGTR